MLSYACFAAVCEGHKKKDRYAMKCEAVYVESNHALPHHLYLQGNENYTGIAARDVANALKVLATASRGVAAGFGDQQPQAQEAVLQAAKTVMENSLNLVLQAKKSLADPTAPESRNNLARVSSLLKKSAPEDKAGARMIRKKIDCVNFAISCMAQLINIFTLTNFSVRFIFGNLYV